MPSNNNSTAIFIVGPSSSGKTTLCTSLVRRLGLRRDAYITEVARTVMRETGFSRRDVARIDMQLAIQSAQLEAERTARRRLGGGKDGDSEKKVFAESEFKSTSELQMDTSIHAFHPTLILSDRSAIDPIVYAGLMASSSQEATTRRAALIENPDFQVALPLYRRSIFCLLAPVQDWLVDDGVRSLDNNAECHAAFREVLDDLLIPYCEIDGSMRLLEERVSFVMGLARL